MKKVFLSAFLVCMCFTYPVCAELELEDIFEAFHRVCPPPPVESPKAMASSGKKVDISITLNKNRSRRFDGERAAHYLENADFLDADETQSKIAELFGCYLSISFRCLSPGRFEDEEIGYLNIAIVKNVRTGVLLSYLDEVQFSSESSEFSGIGLGTTALKLFIDLSDDLGCKWSALRVVSDSPYAGRLYERFGFRVTERSVRRLGRFDVTPQKFIEDTSNSRQFSPPICMERQRGQWVAEFDPSNTVDYDLLTVLRGKEKPLPITPQRAKSTARASKNDDREHQDVQSHQLAASTANLGDDTSFLDVFYSGSASSTPRKLLETPDSKENVRPLSNDADTNHSLLSMISSEAEQGGCQATPPASPLRRLSRMKAAASLSVNRKLDY